MPASFFLVLVFLRFGAMFLLFERSLNDPFEN